MSDIVTEWLSRNGGPRRFEPGLSSETLALKDWLAERGYHLSWLRGRITVTKAGRGRPRRLTQDGLIAFVDQLRVAEGLEPIRRAA